MTYDLETFDRSGNSDADYFRTNNWGIGLLRAAMRATKVLDTDHQPPVWPSFPEGRVTVALEEQYVEMVMPIRGFRSTNSNLVPIGKFCSNDGWLVVPEECILIANALDQLDAFTYYQDEGNMLIDHTTQSMYLVKDFADYCRHAAEYGGFHVW